VDPLDAAAHLDRLDTPRSHVHPLSKPGSPNLGLRLVSSTWGRGSRVPRPTPHRHRGRAIISLDILRIGGDSVHVVPLEFPPEDERYRQCLDHEEFLLHGSLPDVDGQRHIRVHFEQPPRGVTHLGPGRRPRRVLGPPLGQRIRADHAGSTARVDHRPRGDGGLPWCRLVRRANLKILLPSQQQHPLEPREVSPTTTGTSGRDRPRRSFPRGGKRDVTGGDRGVGADRGG